MPVREEQSLQRKVEGSQVWYHPVRTKVRSPPCLCKDHHLELVDEERVWRHWGKEDQNESTVFKKRIHSWDIRTLMCFSEIPNLVPVVRKKMGLWKAQHDQC